MINLPKKGAQESSDEETSEAFLDVGAVECECAINVQLQGDQKEMTWSDAPGNP